MPEKLKKTTYMDRRKVIGYIEEKRLFTRQDKVLVAVSGGADSVALLCLLHEAGYDCEAAHCNFHLRGAESERDETFVRRLCEARQVPLHVAHFDTRRTATTRRISIEMAARELRYEWFEQVRRACGAAVIAVAHHRDDSAETFLLNLLRGTGINGLRGIRPRNGKVVRPLLCLDRTEIIDYLAAIDQPYVTDSSNLQDEYLRNKIRLNLLPLMQSILPSARENILRTAAHLDSAATLYNKGIEEARQRVCHEQGIGIEALKREAEPATLLFELLRPMGFNAAQAGEIARSLDGEPGKVFVSKEWRVVRDRKWLLAERRTETAEAAKAPTLVRSDHAYTPDFVIPHDRRTACFDADKLNQPLTLRRWQPEDVFVPFGMRGRKRVNDYMTSRKFSVFQRERQWVLCCGDEIIWLVGERTDNRFRVDEKTRRVTVFTIDQWEV